jgi:histidine ammonia-lyase/tyrosine ammonia-lyase
MRPSWQDLVHWGNPEHQFESDIKITLEVRKSYESLKQILKSNSQSIYGLHTGYGSNVTDSVSDSDWKNHQVHLLNYLCVGQGPVFEARVVRRALKLQAYKVGLGFSGVHPETYELLIQLSNSTNLPTVPIWGSLGASGDLIPMAHAVAPLFSGRDPQSPRDVIALVNTNSMMASYAIEIAEATKKFLKSAHKITGLVGWALGVQSEDQSPWSLETQEELQWAHRSAQEIKNQTAHFTNTRKLIFSGKRSSLIPTQEKYSIRCAPQIFCNAQENLEFSISKIFREALSVADNPLIPKCSQDRVAHGGLFYTSNLATASDLMSDILFRIGETLDRQILILMDPQTSHGLPTNLQISQYDHCKGLHQLVSSLVQILRSKSTPSRNLSFSCEGNNQDVVPCSMNALHLVSENLGVCKSIMEAADFIAERACYLAAEKEVPLELSLPHFKKKNSTEMVLVEKRTSTKGETYEFR